MVISQIVDPFFPECPIRNILARVLDKWSFLLLMVLDGYEQRRFNQLLKDIPDISRRMLTQTLRQLEADGLVERQVFAEVPLRVEYRLTPIARTLTPLLKPLTSWALTNYAAIMENRRKYLQ
ncbi:MAG: helix-turn-helix transcriptional regulator [Bacteroidaceae bacterium]|nr:helix-turn-helix transcriptional regulator [Bacteroidaceae bacterium]